MTRPKSPSKKHASIVSHRKRNILKAYVAGRLNARERDVVQTYLKRSASGRAVVRKMKRTSRARPAIPWLLPLGVGLILGAAGVFLAFHLTAELPRPAQGLSVTHSEEQGAPTKRSSPDHRLALEPETRQVDEKPQPESQPAGKPEATPTPQAAEVDEQADKSAPKREAGLFVAVGFGLRRLVSSDGIHWEHEEEQVDFRNDKNFELRGATHGNGLILGVGGGLKTLVLTTRDGKEWKDASVDQGFMSDAAYGNGVFVGVGRSEERRVGKECRL